MVVLLDNDETFRKFMGESSYLFQNMQEKQDLGFDDQIYIAYVGMEPIGLIELRILNREPYINIGIIPEKRGKHYGKLLLSYFVEYLFKLHSKYASLYTSINPQNYISINNVLSLGFKQVNKTKYVKKRD